MLLSNSQHAFIWVISGQKYPDESNIPGRKKHTPMGPKGETNINI